jgi:TQO small subunit DoxA
MKVELIGTDSQPVETWNTETLSQLPSDAIHNDFAYNVFGAGPYGIVAAMGASDHHVATAPRARQEGAQRGGAPVEGDELRCVCHVGPATVRARRGVHPRSREIVAAASITGGTSASIRSSGM